MSKILIISTGAWLLITTQENRKIQSYTVVVYKEHPIIPFYLNESSWYFHCRKFKFQLNLEIEYN